MWKWVFYNLLNFHSSKPYLCSKDVPYLVDDCLRESADLWATAGVSAARRKSADLCACSYLWSLGRLRDGSLYLKVMKIHTSCTKRLLRNTCFVPRSVRPKWHLARCAPFLWEHVFRRTKIWFTCLRMKECHHAGLVLSMPRWVSLAVRGWPGQPR